MPNIFKKMGKNNQKLLQMLDNKKLRGWGEEGQTNKPEEAMI